MQLLRNQLSPVRHRKHSNGYDNYFHLVMNYGLIFLGNSSHSAKMYEIKRNIISIITGCRSVNSCRDLIKNFKNLPLPPQYILPPPIFLVNNKNKFKLNSDANNTNTRQKYNFHQRSSNLQLHQKEVCSTGIKVFHSLSQCTKNISDNSGQFRSAVEDYLHAQSFQSTYTQMIKLNPFPTNFVVPTSTVYM